MSEQWQIRRDTLAIVRVSTPALGEMWYITDTHTVVIGDGSSVGGIPVGHGPADFKFTGKATVSPGWLLADGRTLGPTGSGADVTGDFTRALYECLWNDWSETAAPVLGGGRGLSADEDWTALKAITLPDRRGRTGVGANAVGPLTARAVGDTWGVEEHQLTIDEMPLHGHPYRASSSPSDSTESSGGIALDQAGDSNRAAFTGTPSTSANEQIGGEGGGVAHPNEQPSMAEFVWIKL